MLVNPSSWHLFSQPRLERSSEGTKPRQPRITIFLSVPVGPSPRTSRHGRDGPGCSLNFLLCNSRKRREGNFANLNLNRKISGFKGMTTPNMNGWGCMTDWAAAYITSFMWQFFSSPFIHLKVRRECALLVTTAHLWKSSSLTTVNWNVRITV